MPNREMERIEPESKKAQVDAAISACVAEVVRSGKPQDQAVAMCIDMAKRKQGGTNG